MMRLPAFRYLAPQRLEDALRMLSEAGPAGSLVGGGTDLYPNMKRLQVSPSVVVGLRGLRELNGVDFDGGDLIVGAGTTLTQLIRNARAQRDFRPIVEAALLISTPLLRNMGTVGGNLCLDTRCHFLNQSAFWRKAVGSCMKAESDICLVAPGGTRCWAITSADLPPLLIALEATILLTSSRGARELPLIDLYRNDGIDYLRRAPDEILTEIRVPALEGKRAGYLKLRRRGTFDFPALGVAASLVLDESRICRSARIVLGAVGPSPLLVPEAAELVGQRVDEDLISRVAETIHKKHKPMHLADYTHSYRRQMIAINIRRLLAQLSAIGE